MRYDPGQNRVDVAINSASLQLGIRATLADQTIKRQPPVVVVAVDIVRETAANMCKQRALPSGIVRDVIKVAPVTDGQSLKRVLDEASGRVSKL